MPAKTTAQWRREFPAYDTAIRAVEHLLSSWSFTGRAPHVVAHIHPDTHLVSIILHGSRVHTNLADRLIKRFGYPAGDWVLEPGHDHEIWRKQVAR